MSDRSDRSDFEEKLWRSAQEEKPAAGVHERALAAALAAGAGGGGGGGSNAPPSPNAALGAKGAALGWKLAAAVAVVAGAAAIFATSRPSEKRAPAVPVVAVSPSSVGAPMLQAPAAPQASAAPPSEPTTAAPEPAAPVSVPVRAPSPSASAPRALTLADEVAAIDAARASLARGDTTAALRALDGYDRTFPRGRLAPEAAALRARANRALPPLDGGSP